MQFDYKTGRKAARSSRHRPLVTAFGAVTIILVVSVINAKAQGGETAITCTNPVSGVSWQIRIDYGRSTVDSNPARIGGAEISWHDATDGGNYTLDRKSGNLTVVVASSTGGYFLHDRCKLQD
jgi:hypothetical protein